MCVVSRVCFHGWKVIIIFKFRLFFEFVNVFFPRDYEFLRIIDYKNYIIQKKKENLDYRKQWYPTTAFL